MSTDFIYFNSPSAGGKGSADWRPRPSMLATKAQRAGSQGSATGALTTYYTTSLNFDLQCYRLFPQKTVNSI